MGNVQHHSIGENSRKTADAKQEVAERRKELVKRYSTTPWEGYGLDQLSVWVVWASLAGAVFLYCTVSAVVMALK